MERLLTIVGRLSIAVLLFTVSPAFAPTLFTTGTAYAMAGEEQWEMVDRIFYHSGSWFISYGVGASILSQSNVQELIEITEIEQAIPEKDFALGTCIFGPGKDNQIIANFLMARGEKGNMSIMFTVSSTDERLAYMWQ